MPTQREVPMSHEHDHELPLTSGNEHVCPQNLRPNQQFTHNRVSLD